MVGFFGAVDEALEFGELVGTELGVEVGGGLVGGLEFGADVFEEGEGEFFGVGLFRYGDVAEGVVEDVAVWVEVVLDVGRVVVVVVSVRCEGVSGRWTHCMVYFPLSILARGSEEGVMCLTTCRICCFSSPTSWICVSSTEATRIRPEGKRLLVSWRRVGVEKRDTYRLDGRSGW